MANQRSKLWKPYKRGMKVYFIHAYGGCTIEIVEGKIVKKAFFKVGGQVDRLAPKAFEVKLYDGSTVVRKQEGLYTQRCDAIRALTYQIKRLKKST